MTVRHFTTYVRDIETLKKNGNFSDLENLLIELVKATEAESAVDDMGVAPAYYSELAICIANKKIMLKKFLSWKDLRNKDTLVA